MFNRNLTKDSNAQKGAKTTQWITIVRNTQNTEIPKEAQECFARIADSLERIANALERQGMKEQKA